MTGPAQPPICGPSKVVLERGLGELSLQTRNGAKHAQRGSHAAFWERIRGRIRIALHLWPSQQPGSDDSLVSTYLKEEIGDHLAEEAVQTIKDHLQAGAMEVSQQLLRTDMQRYHMHVWDASKARYP